LFESWRRMHQHLNANAQRAYQRTVYNFCLHRQRHDPTCFVPDPQTFTVPRPHIAPVLFGPEEVTKLIDLASKLRSYSFTPVRPAALRLAIVLLYTTGMRRGELVRLTLGDVDGKNGVLRIRASKFHKSRFIPLSNDACKELKHYLKQRLSLTPQRCSDDDPLLCNFVRGRFRAYTDAGIYGCIHQLLKQADIKSADGRTPRLHDFRYVFAIQALLRWYHEGADVQVQLPKLAIYMGHVSIYSTAYYLRFIPELAEQASECFGTHFGHLIKGEAS
jgi:integrase/recombinase XerD